MYKYVFKIYIFIVIYNDLIVCITSSVQSFSCINKKIFIIYKNISFIFIVGFKIKLKKYVTLETVSIM